MSWASLVFLNPELGLEEGRGKAARVFLVFQTIGVEIRQAKAELGIW